MKRPNLAEIAKAAGSSRRQPVVPAVAVQTDTGEGRAGRSPSRAGTKQVAGHFPQEVSWQLRELAVARRTTVQHLLGEALNDLFQKHGMPEIVPVNERG